MERHVEEANLRQIARQEGRARETVTKVVKSGKMHTYIQSLRERLNGLGEAAIDVVEYSLSEQEMGVLVIGKWRRELSTKRRVAAPVIVMAKHRYPSLTAQRAIHACASSTVAGITDLPRLTAAMPLAAEFASLAQMAGR